MGEYAEYEGTLDASGMRLAVVAGRFNDHVTAKLLEGALDTLHQLGLDDVPVHWVPGAFEIPIVAQRLAPSNDAVICLGAVIRGETAHFDLVASQCAAGIQRVALDTGTPVVFGVLATDDVEQALARAGGAHSHAGSEAARTAVEMVSLLRRFSSPMVDSAPASRPSGDAPAASP
ncbi:MAG TPA: 6,7-dimethyl-8-ribityllumazine synthase [Acidimicrobiia bacterium]|jgi:6,7-dimethyl-8-ribityllumazine synthase